MQQQKVAIPSSGKKLSAVIHYPAVKTEKLAIICPGYLDTKDYGHLVGLANDLTEKGYTVVRFDPLGTWESEGYVSDYSVTQYLKDIGSVLEYILHEGDYKYVLLGGHSLGGMVSILYAAQDPRISAALAIMSPYSLVEKMSQDRLDKWEKEGFRTSLRDMPGTTEKIEFCVPFTHPIDAKQYNVLDVVQNLHVPLVLIAGAVDDVVQTKEVQAIFSKANEPKKMVIIDGIGHDYRHNQDEIKKVNGKILELLV